MIEARSPDARLDAGELEDAVDRALDELQPHAGVMGADASGGVYSLRICVDADTPQKALAEATRIWKTTARSAGLPLWEASEVEVIDFEQMVEALSRPLNPELVGIAEVAEVLGVSKQRANQLVKGARFPQPVANLAAGPVWTKPAVLRFNETWTRTPGRPRKVSA